MPLRERVRSTGGVLKDDGTRTPAGYVTWIEVGEADRDTLDRGAALHRTAQTPADEGRIELWLAELAVITARRRDDEGTDALRLSAYATRLRDYPADVAKAALLDHRWRFWPSWAELAEVCDALVKPRRELQMRLDQAAAKAEQRAIPAPGQHHETRDERRVSAEKARDILAGINLRAGMEAQEAAEADRKRRADAEVGDLMRRTQRQPDQTANAEDAA